MQRDIVLEQAAANLQLPPWLAPRPVDDPHGTITATRDIELCVKAAAAAQAVVGYRDKLTGDELAAVLIPEVGMSLGKSQQPIRPVRQAYRNRAFNPQNLAKVELVPTLPPPTKE